MSEVYRTTSRELFHGHHPECAYTVEGDPKACGCEVRLTEPNWRAERTGNCPCGGQCHHGDRIEWCSESCREAAHRTPAASETVEAAWKALIIELDEPQPGMTSWGSIQRHRPRIEAAIRAEFSGSLAALREGK